VRIFVGFGYRPRNLWISELVFPVIRAFGDEVVVGGDLQGEQITEGVRQSIRGCQALIGFMTRRDPIGDTGRWTTHRWVSDELAHALALNLHVAEVREVGVDDQGGIAEDRQRLTYDEAARDRCLVDLVAVIGRWHRAANSVLLQLLPPERIAEIVAIYRRPGFSCKYRLMIAGNEGQPTPAQLQPIKGGLFIRADGVPPDALIQVELEHGATSWISGFESVDAGSVVLQRA
jgi:hypothetical protein